MENFIDRLDIETINAIKNCTYEVPDNRIDNFLQLSKNVAPLPDNSRVPTVIQHDEFNTAINFPFMK